MGFPIYTNWVYFLSLLVVALLGCQNGLMKCVCKTTRAYEAAVRVLADVAVIAFYRGDVYCVRTQPSSYRAAGVCPHRVYPLLPLPGVHGASDRCVDTALHSFVGQPGVSLCCFSGSYGILVHDVCSQHVFYSKLT